MAPVPVDASPDTSLTITATIRQIVSWCAAPALALASVAFADRRRIQNHLHATDKRVDRMERLHERTQEAVQRIDKRLDGLQADQRQILDILLKE